MQDYARMADQEYKFNHKKSKLDQMTARIIQEKDIDNILKMKILRKHEAQARKGKTLEEERYERIAKKLNLDMLVRW